MTTPGSMRKGVQNVLVSASPHFPVLQHSAQGQLWYKHVAGVPVKSARADAHSRLLNMLSDNSSADIGSLIWLQSMLRLLVAKWSFLLHLVRRIEAPWKGVECRSQKRLIHTWCSLWNWMNSKNGLWVAAGLWQVLLTLE